MILRFKTTETKPRYIAINTKNETYTMGAENVVTEWARYIEISADCFDRILCGEIDFNSWGYVNDIRHETISADDEDIPLF